MAIEEGEHRDSYITELSVFQSLRGLKTVFDVGARMRMDESLVPSIVDYLKLQPKVTYHLFEPNPEFAQKLRENIQGKPNVILNEFGLGEEEGDFVYNNGLQSFKEKREEGQKFHVTTLANYCKKAKVKRIDFLKTDVEGWDIQVLRGGMDLLPKIRYIQFEDWDNISDFRALLGEWFTILEMGGRNYLCINKGYLLNAL